MLNRINEVIGNGFEGVKVAELREMVSFLMNERESMGSGREGKRKGEILAILKSGEFKIEEIAEKLGIDKRNVSSVLSALKKDGHIIWNDEDGRKMYKGQREIEAAEQVIILRVIKAPRDWRLLFLIASVF